MPTWSYPVSAGGGGGGGGDGIAVVNPSIQQVGVAPNEIWYPQPYMSGSIVNAQLLSDNLMFAMPFFQQRARTIDRISFRVTAAGAAGKLARVGIYRNTPGFNTINPDALIVDGGDQAVDTLGVKTSVVAAALAAETLYWLTYITGGAVGAGAGLAGVSSTVGVNWGSFGVDTGLTLGRTGITVAQAYGALPATFPAGGVITSLNPILIAVRYDT